MQSVTARKILVMRTNTTRAAAQARRPAFAPLDYQGDLFAVGKPTAIVNVGRRCRCGGESFLPGPGAGPHAARLTCVTCGAFGGWLSKTSAAEIAREVSSS